MVALAKKLAQAALVRAGPHGPGNPDAAGFITKAEQVLASPPRAIAQATNGLTPAQWRSQLAKAGVSKEGFELQVEQALRQLEEVDPTRKITVPELQQLIHETRTTFEPLARRSPSEETMAQARKAREDLNRIGATTPAQQTGRERQWALEAELRSRASMMFDSYMKDVQRVGSKHSKQIPAPRGMTKDKFGRLKVDILKLNPKAVPPRNGSSPLYGFDAKHPDLGNMSGEALYAEYKELLRADTARSTRKANLGKTINKGQHPGSMYKEYVAGGPSTEYADEALRHKGRLEVDAERRTTGDYSHIGGDKALGWGRTSVRRTESGEETFFVEELQTDTAKTADRAIDGDSLDAFDLWLAGKPLSQPDRERKLRKVVATNRWGKDKDLHDSVETEDIIHTSTAARAASLLEDGPAYVAGRGTAIRRLALRQIVRGIEDGHNRITFTTNELRHKATRGDKSDKLYDELPNLLKKLARETGGKFEMVKIEGHSTEVPSIVYDKTGRRKVLDGVVLSSMFAAPAAGLAATDEEQA